MARCWRQVQPKLHVLIGELLDEHLAEPEILTILFEEAKTRGFLRKDTDPLVAAAMIYMSFSGLIHFGPHLRRVSSLTLADEASRRSLVEKALHVVFHGVLK